MGTAGAAWSSAATDAPTDPPTLPIIAAALTTDPSPATLTTAGISSDATIPGGPEVSAEQRGEVA